MEEFLDSLKYVSVYDLSWLVPCVVGAIGLLIVAATLVRADFSWQRVVVTALFVAICGASVIAKINFAKDGSFAIETRDAVGKIVSRFEEIARTNTDAIEQIKTSIVQLNTELARVKTAAGPPPAGAPSSPPAPAPAPPASIRKLDEDIRRSVELNTRNLGEITVLKRVLKPF